MNRGLDNSWDGAQHRLVSLEAMYDEGTMSHLDRLGMGDGWQCLEVGAGGGSIARWMARRVGPAGHVLATDIDTRLLETNIPSNLAVQKHDITTDPLPEDVYDLVHARLVVNNLPPDQREPALRKLVRSLKVGGFLCVESFDFTSVHSASELYAKLARAAIDTLRSIGVDSLYGRGLSEKLRAAGLTDIEGEGRCRVYRGGSPMAKILALAYSQIAPRILQISGMPRDEFERALALFDDPTFEATSPIMMSCWGKKPA